MEANRRPERDRLSARAGLRARRTSHGWRSTLRAVVCAAVIVPVLAACGSSGGGSSSGNSSASGKISGQLVVFAATSLTEAFDKIGAGFEKAHPDVTIKFNYNGSSSLAASINQGAPADVFASAAPANMKTVTDAGNAVGTPQTFASNTAEIMVEKGNPKKITSVKDLANSAVKVVVCAPAVPCGAVAEEVFKNAGVTVKPVSEETNVGGVVTKVTLGEADAGIVYVTDVKANEGKADGVPIPADQNAITEYPIAQVKGAPNATAAKAFISYVLGADGQKVLHSFGFKPPGS
jgi:molybdate transport system substrate-binding protein